MKRSLFLAAFACAACSSTPPPPQPSTAATNPVRLDTVANIVEAVDDLVQAVNRHDKTGVLAQLEAEYRTKEHDDRFEGRADLFLNELFCGQVLHSDQQWCLVFDEIQEMKKVYVEEKNGSPNAAFDVKTAQREIRVHMKIAMNPNGTVAGFVGPKGITQVEKGYR